MFNSKLKLLIIFIALFGVLLTATPCSAQEPIFGSGGYSTGCNSEKGDCELNDFLIIAIKVSRNFIGLVGSLVMLAFIYGGFLFLTSAGSSERVQKGKSVLIGALIGMAIVLGGYLIVNTIFQVIGSGDAWRNSNWFEKREVGTQVKIENKDTLIRREGETEEEFLKRAQEQGYLPK